MGTKNASDEKTVREADLKGCQRQGKKTDYRSNPKNRAYSRVECSDLWGGDLTEKLVRSIYDSATQFSALRQLCATQPSNASSRVSRRPFSSLLALSCRLWSS